MLPRGQKPASQGLLLGLGCKPMRGGRGVCADLRGVDRRQLLVGFDRLLPLGCANPRVHGILCGSAQRGMQALVSGMQ